MNFAAVEDALVAWVEAGSGLTGAVIWAQDAPRLEAPYISLRLTTIRRRGLDWVNVEDNPTPSPGEEVLQQARGVRECSLAMQCFGAATGAASAVAILTDVVSSARRESVQEGLRAAGVGLGTIGPVQFLDGFIGSSLFEPRATVEVNFFLAQESSEPSTFIEHVELENTSTGEDFTVDWE